jgi:hypothetical protein
MENSRILKWRTWYAAHKGVVIVGLLWALVTACFGIILCIADRACQGSSTWGAIDTLVAILAVPTTALPSTLISVFHLKLENYFTVKLVCFDVAVNVLAYVILVAFVNGLVRCIKELIRPTKK